MDRWSDGRSHEATTYLADQSQHGTAPNTFELSFVLELANTPVRAPDGTPIVVDYELPVRSRRCSRREPLSGPRCVDIMAP